MKKVLVTGAAGTIGLQVIRYLLIEGKYEITALDVKNSHTYKRLKKYRKRINIVYGDVNDAVLIDALVKDHDIVIHLAGVLPPFADLKEELCHIVDYEGTKNIVTSINDYNPKCHLFYASSTTVYGPNKKEISVKDAVVVDSDDYYSKIKYDTEKLIKENLKNYTIFRIPAVMCDLKGECFMYNIPLNSEIELISSFDAGYAFATSIENTKELNKKVFNLAGGEKCRVKYRDFLIKILSTYGLSFRYLLTCFLVDKNFFGGYYKDSETLDNIIHYRKYSVSSYYNNLEEEYSGLKRLIPRLLAKPIVGILKRRK